jgi:DNA-binding transcriptional LysR family regulator
VELRDLRYFVAVAEELNFSRAARRLQMAQPPLSVAIRQLEQEIGASLFVRTSREVKLTEAGETLLVGARRTLAEADAAVAAARRVGSGEAGTLRVAYKLERRLRDAAGARSNACTLARRHRAPHRRRCGRAA